MTAFYNEIDPYAAQWLRNLIAAGHIAPGVVDERPIQEIEAWELAEYTQCHFFAGIGVWSHALRSAGWSDDRPIWTGSCPCQPFSNAGQKKGIQDERHLWPFWYDLIEQRKPPIIVGEQVASKDGLGWFDIVSTDLEASGYATGASDLCAAGFEGAHLRQRLYFVGLANRVGRGQSRQGWSGYPQEQRVTQCSSIGGLDDTASARQNGPLSQSESDPRDEARLRVSGDRREVRAIDGAVDGLGDTSGRNAGTERIQCSGEHRQQQSHSCGGSGSVLHPRQTRSFDDADWLLCRNPAGEPSWRPVEPGTFPLAHGVASRVGKLRAFGNALDTETAISFCEAVKEICDDLRPVREFDL